MTASSFHHSRAFSPAQASLGATQGLASALSMLCVAAALAFETCRISRLLFRKRSPQAVSARSPASTVFCRSIAIVMGPTPPGTGVIAEATGLAAA